MPFYTVRHHTEEFQCPKCGVPLYVGERAYQDGPDGTCYCSAYCAGAEPQPYRPLAVEVNEYLPRSKRPRKRR
jgi:hypothetical protein